uniref:Membrane-bound lytic murein transglycosylase D n=1 Tax=Candidatus Kentrum sp. TUN TaxID=2126343 RepID=A0A450ZVA8_9GAMM|nr:MAG: membrane-bound lytic murein transglycosylase D [Candidatus Kentron sp. TUN]VFK57693.1 MAG: membrane-bound lytic murein transglycosylase D [Candidatus Kentron sp. TUN]VFK66474.1 MAG: membrane-bound lytic murein transglycosylase D [Candidatus Kentron sp. TUN]
MKNIPHLRNLIGLVFFFSVLGNISGCEFLTGKSESIGTRGKWHDDLWNRIQASLTLQDMYDIKEVQSHRTWFKRNQPYLDRSTDRGSRYLYYILEEVERQGMPGEIALLPIIESAFQPFAHSPSRASGIWQFIPSTGKRYGLKQNWWYDGRRNILASTQAALKYLKYLHRKFDGDWLLAVAAYNAGEGNVEQAIKHNRNIGKSVDFWSLDLPSETRSYVPKLLALASIVQNPAKYNLTLRRIPNRPYFQQVSISGQIELALVAKIANLSMDEIRQLNPAFRRWATDPNGPHYLLLPIDRVGIFRRGLAQLPSKQHIRWRKHVVKKGESLSAIAVRFKTTVTALRKRNNLKGDLIRIGQRILIPSIHSLSDYRPNSKLALSTRKSAFKRKSAKKRHIYTVRSGDNLWLIARRYRVSVAQLVSWNDLANNNVLIPGQRLNLYVGAEKSEKS